MKEVSNSYIYTFGYSKDECSLSHLEMRSFFGKETDDNILKSTISIDPSRSPFIRERIEVVYEGETLQEIISQVAQINMLGRSFKVIFSKINDRDESTAIAYKERREIERVIGWEIEGKADVHQPDHTFGMATLNGRWYFGHYQKNEAIWQKHVKKPREYSTALSSKIARTIVNIGIPHDTKGVRAIDPCCGIGTVLVEAHSMGINIEGRDINPLVAVGARENMEYFGFQGRVTLGAIADVTEKYDVAIIDLPYNLYTHITRDEQDDIIKQTRRISQKAIIITIEDMDDLVKGAGFQIVDRGVTLKGNFKREILVCQ
ncbi:TRM11 family SAM-dependent methyltransferase [Sutcliffiella rhizosphaerae]|uniref:TRM11 family SAM-dependent methyltransferase n=1 Tax=Sutcliffiella rhizosphaerae TaxID=2880967 RepID=UPI001E443583|nr:RNA methyltransferase [Sutcliffiella rhizosphaerae]